MKVAYVRWRDACVQHADYEDHLKPVEPGLSELAEVGFLLAENDEAIVLGMEQVMDEETAPGRFRLHIPKGQIVEMRTAEIESAFKTRRRKVPA